MRSVRDWFFRLVGAPWNKKGDRLDVSVPTTCNTVLILLQYKLDLKLYLVKKNGLG